MKLLSLDVFEIYFNNNGDASFDGPESSYSGGAVEGDFKLVGISCIYI